MNRKRTEYQPKWEPKKLLEALEDYLDDYRAVCNRNPSLTNPQKLLLSFFLDGNTIAVCTEVGPALGQLSGHKAYQGHFAKKSLYKLYQEGLLTKDEESIYGIRWATFRALEDEVAFWKS